MKKLLLIALAICSLNVYAQEAKKYAVKSGYIKYELTGNTTGIKELWWDNYGSKSCELEKSTTTTKMFGIKNTEETNMTTVLVKDKFWVADYIAGTGTVGTVPFYQEGQDFANEMTEEEQKEFADQVIAQMGGKKLGKEDIGGYTCDVIKIMGAKTWIYKGLNLKTEAKMLGVKANEVFVAFKPNTSVPESKFNPPSGVEFDDVSQQMGEVMGGFGELREAMQEMDEEIVPVEYPFEKFKKIVNSASFTGYRNMGANNMFGMHSATFMNGAKRLMIIAQSDENEDIKEYAGVDRFKHNGHTCYYVDVEADEEEEEEAGSSLIVEYPNHDMNIVISVFPKCSKTELLKMEDQLQF